MPTRAIIIQRRWIVLAAVALWVYVVPTADAVPCLEPGLSECKYVEESTLTDPIPDVVSTAYGFGGAVAISKDGSTLVAGISKASSNRGGVAVYTRSGLQWTYRGLLIDLDRTPCTVACNDDDPDGDMLGQNVAVSSDGSTIAASSSIANDRRGVVVIFTRVGNTWEKQATLSRTGAAVGERLGSVSLSNDGNYLAVGAQEAFAGEGLVVVFKRTAGLWSSQETMRPAAAAPLGFLGSEVVISGRRSEARTTATGRVAPSRATETS